MQLERAIILFVRDERLEGAAKPLPASYRSAGYEALNRRIAERLSVLRRDGIDLVVVTEGDRGEIPCSRMLRQRGGTFGERLGNAITDTLALGYREVVVVGNDCPTIAPSDIAGAFDKLRAGATIVAAPTSDGGAYLIGTRSGAFDAARFQALPWQTGSLFQSLASFRGAATLQILRDDFDDWNGAQALRALALLFSRRVGTATQPLPALPLRSSARMKALTRIFLPAPPVA